MSFKKITILLTYLVVHFKPCLGSETNTKILPIVLDRSNTISHNNHLPKFVQPFPTRPRTSHTTKFREEIILELSESETTKEDLKLIFKRLISEGLTKKKFVRILHKYFHIHKELARDIFSQEKSLPTTAHADQKIRFDSITGPDHDNFSLFPSSKLLETNPMPRLRLTPSFEFIDTNQENIHSSYKARTTETKKTGNISKITLEIFGEKRKDLA